MAYEYGSIDLGIRNPFKVEGAIRAIAGLPVVAMGLISILSVQSLVAGGNKLQAWVTLAVAIVLLVWGLGAIGRGLFQLMRFFAGRGVPTSLAKNYSKSESHVNEPGVAYSEQMLEQMLQGRKNLTFTEPNGWFSRALHTILPRLLFLPYAYRNLVLRMAQGLVQTFMGFLCYGLAWFSGSTGLTDIATTPVLDWLAIVLSFYLIIVWWGKRQPLSPALQKTNIVVGVGGIVLWLVAAILLPMALSYIHNSVSPLPPVVFSSAKYIFMVTGFALVTVVLVMALVRLRLGNVEPKSEVSEMRDTWQEPLHPQELFINFENIVMANRRYREVPNRVYRELDANLVEEGSDDKGRFSGELIQETQPVYREITSSPLFKYLKVGATVVGHGLKVLAAVWLYLAIDDLSTIFNSGTSSTLASLLESGGSLLTMLVIWMFGSAIAHIAHTFWAEMQFESLLVYFQCQGTYAETKLATGTSIYDSTRSENTVVRSSLTPWLLTTRVVSSCFTESGARNLEFPRFILEMHRNDEVRDAIVGEVKEFMRERETIASLNNERDLEAAAQIYQINQQSRNGPDSTHAIAATQLDLERAQEYGSGGADEDQPKS